MRLDTLATELLDVAHDALPSVDRYFVAGGPEFARTCTLLATYVSLVGMNAQGATGLADFPSAIAGCAAQPIPQVTVVYAKDCYPMADGKTLPAPSALTAWSTAYQADCQTLIDAVYAAALDPPYRLGECSTVTIGQAVFTGPRSDVCTMQLPLSVRQS